MAGAQWMGGWCPGGVGCGENESVWFSGPLSLRDGTSRLRLDISRASSAPNPDELSRKMSPGRAPWQRYSVGRQPPPKGDAGKMLMRQHLWVPAGPGKSPPHPQALLPASPGSGLPPPPLIPGVRSLGRAIPANALPWEDTLFTEIQSQFLKEARGYHHVASLPPPWFSGTLHHSCPCPFFSSQGQTPLSRPRAGLAESPCLRTGSVLEATAQVLSQPKWGTTLRDPQSFWGLDPLGSQVWQGPTQPGPCPDSLVPPASALPSSSHSFLSLPLTQSSQLLHPLPFPPLTLPCPGLCFQFIHATSSRKPSLIS